MSKKKHRQFSQMNQGATLAVGSGEMTVEYRIIRHDLLRVLIMNVIFLAAVLMLYYTNLHSGYLERWFGRILRF